MVTKTTLQTWSNDTLLYFSKMLNAELVWLKRA